MTSAPLPRRELPFAWTDVRQRLQRRVPELLAQLGVHNRPAGAIVTPRNPTRNDRSPGSFVIWLAGEAPGSWRDYATDDKGDVIDLIQYLARLQAKIDAYWWALEFLGLQRGNVRSADQAQQDRERAERDRKAAEAKKQSDDAAKSADLFKHWLTLPGIRGTVAETYLVEARGIDLSRLAHFPGALRFEAVAEHFDNDTGEFTEWPAMVSAMTRGQDCAALHRTFLMPDGSGKAPVKRAKKMYGPAKGAAIRLSPGASGLSPSKAALAGRTDPLILGEGIETTLSAAMAQPDYRAWAAGSLSLLGGLEWPACASAVVLLADNDESAEAKAAFVRAEKHWQGLAAGRPFKVVRSPTGKDFNDFARASE